MGVDAAAVESCRRRSRDAHRRARRRRQLWASRRKLSFKPATGFGSRALPGDKLTRRAWEKSCRRTMSHSSSWPPSARGCRWTVAGSGSSSICAATSTTASCCRGGAAHQGQTTNFRTPGGGFATVLCRLNCAIYEYRPHRRPKNSRSESGESGSGRERTRSVRTARRRSARFAFVLHPLTVDYLSNHPRYAYTRHLPRKLVELTAVHAGPAGGHGQGRTLRRDGAPADG